MVTIGNDGRPTQTEVDASSSEVVRVLVHSLFIVAIVSAVNSEEDNINNGVPNANSRAAELPPISVLARYTNSVDCPIQVNEYGGPINVKVY